MLRCLRLALVTVLLAACPSAARTWHILPDGTGDAPTIQAGVDSAAVGDTVELACGAYYEHDIVLHSGVTLTSATGQPACVTVDAQAQSRIFSCDNVDSTCQIIGITITGGAANKGGGMRCANSAPVITDCAFMSNSANSDGGAIDITGVSSPEITRCSFVANTAGNCGGAVSHDNGTSTSAAPTFRQCEFFENAAGCGGGLGVGGAVGGSLVVEGCTFVGNEAEDGGGLLCWNEGLGELLVSDSVFLRNIANAQGGGAHTGQGESVSITHCVFADNEAYLGGGLRLIDAGVVQNCTFTANSAEIGGGVSCHLPNDASATFLDTILWGNSGIVGTDLHYWTNAPPAILTFACCDVNQAPGWLEAPGPGQLDMSDANFSADPLFCNPDGGDFTIRSNSPCAPPGVTGCGLIGALPVGCGPVSVHPSTWASVKARYR